MPQCSQGKRVYARSSGGSGIWGMVSHIRERSVYGRAGNCCVVWRISCFYYSGGDVMDGPWSVLGVFIALGFVVFFVIAGSEDHPS
jgi:hypothetical protein